MTKYSRVLVLIVLLISGKVFSQSLTKAEGTVTYDVSTKYGKDVLKMGELTILFNNKMVKSVMDSKYLSHRQVTGIFDTKAKTGTVLFDKDSLHLGSILDVDFYNEYTAKRLLEVKDKKIIEGEEKAILGHPCKKHAIYFKMGVILEVYVAEDIEAVNCPGVFDLAIGDGNFDGLILSMNIHMGGREVEYVATSLELGAVADEEFSNKIPEGYEEIDYKELERSMNQLL